MDCKQYNFQNLISGRHYDNEEGWIETPMSERVEMLPIFKEYLLSFCRRGSRPYNAICSISFDNLPKSASIWERLYINNRTRKASFIGRQDFDYDIRCLKEIIVKECY